MNIHRLAFDGNLEGIRQLIASSPDQVNAILELTDKDKAHRITPIFLAAIQGHRKIIKLLLDNKADTEWPDETDHLIDWVDHGRSQEWAQKKDDILPLFLNRDKFKEMKTKDLRFEDYKIIDNEIKDLLKVNDFHLKDALYCERGYYVFLGERGSLERIQEALNTDASRQIQEAILTGALSGSRTEVLKLLHQNKVNLAATLTTGNYKDYSPSFYAAGKGQIELLKILHECGVNLSESIKSGQFSGITPAFTAAVADQVEVLKFLQSIGVNLEEPLKEGEHAGTTLASIASENGQINTLKFLMESGFTSLGIVYDDVRDCENPLFRAALGGQVKVLEHLKSEGLYKRFMPSVTPESEKIVMETYRKVRLPTQQESAAIVCRKLREDRNWFTLYPSYFLEYMKEIPVSVWIENGNFGELIQLFDLYKSKGGNRNDWIEEVVVNLINLKRDFDVHQALPYLEQSSIETLKEAVAPGKPLLQLLQWVSKSENIIKKAKLDQLQQWISGVSKQTSQDGEFWSSAKQSFQDIHEKIKTAPKKSGLKGKGKGKQKTKQDPLESLWKKFDQKIKDSVIPKEVIDRTIDMKVEEWERIYEKYCNNLDDQINEFKETATRECPEELAKRMTEKASQIAIESVNRLSPLILSIDEAKDKSASILALSQLNEQLTRIQKRLEQRLEEWKEAAEKELSTLNEELQRSLSALKANSEFQHKKTAMKDEELVLDLKDFEQIKDSLEERAKSIWNERRNAVEKASSIEELNNIKAQYDEALKESRRKVMATTLPSILAEMPSREPRSLVYLEQRNEALIKENNAYRKKIEQLEKKVMSRPRSPDKIVPVIEKPVRDQLIDKLLPFAPFSKEVRIALKHIQKEGAILSSVKKMVKFLDLFGIAYNRTTGSHNIYTDGNWEIVIANHEGESKPEEVEDVLKVVLNKLSK